MKLAIITQVGTSALHVCFLSRKRERIEVRAAHWEKARSEGSS